MGDLIRGGSVVGCVGLMIGSPWIIMRSVRISLGRGLA